MEQLVNETETDQLKRFERSILKHQQKILKIRCRKASTVILYSMFCIIGGFPGEQIAQAHVKTIWWTTNVITILYCTIIALFGYLFTAEDTNTPELMYVFATSGIMAYIHIFIPFVTRSYRDQLEPILKYIDNEFNKGHVSEEQIYLRRRKYDVVSVGRKWFIFLVVVFIPFFSTSYVYAVSFCDQSCLTDPQLYIFGIPYVDRIHSYTVYTLIYGFTTILVIFGFLGGVSIVLFYIMVGCEFHNAYLDLCVRLNHVIDDTISNLKVTREKQKTRFLADGIMAKWTESEALQIFNIQLAEIVKHHQMLTRAMKMMRPHIEIFSSVNLISFFLIQVPLAYIVLLADYPILLKMKVIEVFILLSNPLHGNCYLGKLCQEMNQLVTEEVYFTRWYELPPRCRKMLHIFLCQTQSSIQFAAFKMYPLSMTTFARAINFVYSIINLQRTTFKKH